MAKPKDYEPPVLMCDNCGKNPADAVAHDDDGTPHPRCGRCVFLAQTGEATHSVALGAGDS